MGASQSEIEQFEDPGPGVTDQRVLRVVKTHENTEDVTTVCVEAEENESSKGFMSELVKIRVTALVEGETKVYNWVVKSMPRSLQK